MKHTILTSYGYAQGTAHKLRIIYINDAVKHVARMQNVYKLTKQISSLLASRKSITYFFVCLLVCVSLGYHLQCFLSMTNTNKKKQKHRTPEIFRKTCKNEYTRWLGIAHWAVAFATFAHLLLNRILYRLKLDHVVKKPRGFCLTNQCQKCQRFKEFSNRNCM